MLLKQIGDKIDEVTGDVITLHQQQLLLFPDYDELAPYLRQRAKTVPLATNESDRHIQVSGSIASSESTIPPPPTTGSTVDPSTVGDGGIRLSVLDTVAGLPTFDYGDRNADLTALAATILDGPANVNSQDEDEDTHSTAMEAHPTFQGTSDTSRHFRHFEAHQTFRGTSDISCRHIRVSLTTPGSKKKTRILLQWSHSRHFKSSLTRLPCRLP